MEYTLMIPPFAHNGYKNFTKQQAEEYFLWYTKQIDQRIKILNEYLKSEGRIIQFDFTEESLIPIWE